MGGLRQEITIAVIILFFSLLLSAGVMYAMGSAAVYSLVQELWWGHV